MTYRRCTTVLSLGLALGLIAAACGDSDASVQATSTSAATAAADSAPAEIGVGPRQVVEAYYTAVDAGDADAVIALFTDPTGEDFDENLRLEVWNAGQEMVRLDRTCTADDATPEGFEVWACEFGDHQYLQAVAGAPPTQIRQTFTVSTVGIEALTTTYVTFGYAANDAFDAWMRRTHPEDAAAAGCCAGETVEEARANGELRRRYAEEWAAHLEATGCSYLDQRC